jgi:hypothetical protein
MREPLPSSYTPQLHCPHCNKELPQPPLSWQWSVVWQCSHCGGAYGTCESDDHITRRLFPIDESIEPFSPLVGNSVATKFCSYAGNDNYYVYALCYPNGLPFYIGSGRNYRATSHEEEAKNYMQGKSGRPNVLKLNAIARLLQRREPIWYHFLALVPTKKRSMEIEAAWINKLGMRVSGGILTNRVPPAIIKKGAEQLAMQYESTVVNRHPALNEYDPRFRNHNTINVNIVPMRPEQQATVPPLEDPTDEGWDEYQRKRKNRPSAIYCKACKAKGYPPRLEFGDILICWNCSHRFQIIDWRNSDGTKGLEDFRDKLLNYYETLPDEEKPKS